MSSSSPPRNSPPASSGSASPNFESFETSSDDVAVQEVASEPQHDPTIVYTPQPLSSYDPNQPDLSPQPISSNHRNLDVSNINSGMDPETAHFIKSQGITMSEYMEQRNALAQYKPPEISNIYSKIDQETANLIKSEDMGVSELMRQEQALDYFNRTKQSLSQVPAGISRTESQDIVPHEKDDGYKFLFNASRSEPEDDFHTLKLLVFLKRKTGRIFPPETVNTGRFLRRRSKLEAKYDRFVRSYGKRPLNEHAFDSKFGYSMYRMSRFIWGDHVIPSDGSSSSTGADGSSEADDSLEFFDPDAPFHHPDMECDLYDLKKDNDPFFIETDDLDVPVLERVKACFGSEINPTRASAKRVSATGKTLIFKAPQPQSVKVKSGRDIELEADTARLEEVREGAEAADLALAIKMSLGQVPEDTVSIISQDQPAPEIDTMSMKKRKIDTLPEAINKQSKRRKLLDFQAKHDENQKAEEEDERLLLAFTDNEDEDDYETLRCLYWYTLNRRTYILQQGAFMPNFENGITKFINEFLPSGFMITTDQCKKKVVELREKFLKFMELNGGEDLSEADFSVPREYKMYQMFKIVWGPSLECGGSCSGADQGVNVGKAVQGAVGNMKVDRVHVADPIPAALTHVSAAGKAQETANVISGPDREFDSDMARAVSNSLKEMRDDTVLQGAIGGLKDLDSNVDSGSVQDSGENAYEITKEDNNVAEPGASTDQKGDNMDIDSTIQEHKAKDGTKPPLIKVYSRRSKNKKAMK